MGRSPISGYRFKTPPSILGTLRWPVRANQFALFARILFDSRVVRAKNGKKFRTPSLRIADPIAKKGFWDWPYFANQLQIDSIANRELKPIHTNRPKSMKLRFFANDSRELIRANCRDSHLRIGGLVRLKVWTSRRSY